MQDMITTLTELLCFRAPQFKTFIANWQRTLANVGFGWNRKRLVSCASKRSPGGM